MSKEKIFLCHDCDRPMVLAPGIDYYCDLKDCPSNLLSPEEKLKKGLEDCFKMFKNPNQPSLDEGGRVIPDTIWFWYDPQDKGLPPFSIDGPDPNNTNYVFKRS